jgi:hypothetical protein
MDSAVFTWVSASRRILGSGTASQVEERCMKKMDDRPNPVDFLIYMAGYNIKLLRRREGWAVHVHQLLTANHKPCRRLEESHLVGSIGTHERH